MKLSHLRRLRVVDVMNEHVIVGRPDDSLSGIASVMERRKIGSVVIVQNRRVVGILTERDFARIAKQGIVQGRDRAKHHMTKPVVTVRSDTSLLDLVRLMRKKHVRHIPVLDRNRRLVGMISSRDLIDTAMEIVRP